MANEIQTSNGTKVTAATAASKVTDRATVDLKVATEALYEVYTYDHGTNEEPIKTRRLLVAAGQTIPADVWAKYFA